MHFYVTIWLLSVSQVTVEEAYHNLKKKMDVMYKHVYCTAELGPSTILTISGGEIKYHQFPTRQGTKPAKKQCNIKEYDGQYKKLIIPYTLRLKHMPCEYKKKKS